MNTPRWTACLVAILLLLPAPARVQADVQAQLVVFPASVRPGDMFYLAGTGFTPRKNLDVFLVCQNWFQSQYGHWEWTVPADMIRDGSFAGFAMRTPQPFSQDPVPCTLYAANRQDPDNPYGVTQQMNIWPANAGLTPIKLQIDVKMRPDCGRHMEKLSISSVAATSGAPVPAPGAHVALTQDSGGHRTVIGTDLPWTGRRTLQIKDRHAVVNGQRVRIGVSGRLGVFQAKPARLQFLVRC